MSLDHQTKRCFVHLATHLHFGKTAKALYLSTPTVSRIIKLLEEELGTILFVRDRQNVALTPAGELFKQYCEESLTQYEKLQENLHALEGVVSGKVRLAASATGAYGIVATQLSALKQEYPQIELELRIVEVGKILETMLAGEADLAITSSEQLPKGVVENKVAELSLGMVMSKLRKHQPKALAEETFLLPAKGSIRTQVMQWFEAQHIAPNLYDDSQGFEGILTLASLGYGIGILPQLVVEESRLKNRVVSVKPPLLLPVINVSVVAKETTLKNAAAKVVWGMLGLQGA